MFISLPEPCLSWGIRTIGKRALTAACSFADYLSADASVTDTFIPATPEACLIPGDKPDQRREVEVCGFVISIHPIHARVIRKRQLEQAAAAKNSQNNHHHINHTNKKRQLTEAA
jgi:hypothetical protein